MKILIACEESQEVCKAFRKLGHEAFSCDILPCSGGNPEWHIKGDVLEQLEKDWDLIIAFPPCTYLSNAGMCNLTRKGATEEYRKDRLRKRDEAMEFALKIYKKELKRRLMRINSLNTDKNDYEIYHKKLTTQINRLKNFIKTQYNLLTPKEALNKFDKKINLIKKDLISFDRKNRTAFINYVRDFSYENELKEKDFQEWFNQELTRRISVWKNKSKKKIIEGSWDGILDSLLSLSFKGGVKDDRKK